MCGINAVINFKGLTKQDLEAFKKMHEKSAERGRDSTGITNQRLEVYKLPKPAEIAVKRKNYNAFLNKSIGLQWVVGHVRHATRGSPEDNRNNHPISVMPKKYQLIHNGFADAEKTLKNKDKYKGMSDTYNIALAIKQEWIEKNLLMTVKNAYKHFSMSSSVIVATKTEIAIARRNNPLMYAFKDKTIFITQQKEFLPEETSNLNELKNEELVVWNLKGIKKQDKILSPPYKHAYRASNSFYRSYFGYFDDESDEKHSFEFDNKPINVKKHQRWHYYD